MARRAASTAAQKASQKISKAATPANEVTAPATSKPGTKTSAEKYPYSRFLLWSAIGGTLWSAYTCGLAYAVGTALADFPLASVVISGTITTLLLGVIFWKLKRDRRSARKGSQISIR